MRKQTHIRRRMGEKGVGESSNRKQIRQPPSVPFIWEVKPGIAKKDWKPAVSSGTRVVVVPPPPPMKLIAAVPFEWEEKPGTPLSTFYQQPESAPHTPRQELIALPSPPMYWYPPEHNNCKYVNHNHYWEGNFGDKQEMYNLDVESFRFETDDSFSSAPSLLANCLVSSAAISTAAPVPETTPRNDMNNWMETPSSPVSETDSSTSSYATGISSLEGPSFLERLFPLYSPNSEFIRKSMHSRRALFTPPELKGRNLGDESNIGVMVRRPPTLGELIMMSRRRSCQIKADQMRKQNSSMECMNEKFLGCCIFGSSMKMIERLQRKMQQTRLKLI